MGKTRLLPLGTALIMVTGCATAEPVPAPPPSSLFSATFEGDTEFTPIALTIGMASLVGSHAEWNAKGQYVRVRLVITNVGRSSVPFDTRRQLLLLEDGATAAPDQQAMLIKRQPGAFDLGAAVRVEFDLYYDVPKDAKPAALRVFGGPTLSDGKDERGTDLKLS